MKEKACANMEAAKLLASHSFFDSAASRAYYSVYLMAWYYVGLYGFHPSSESIYSRRTVDGNHYWKHYEFPVFLNEEGFIGPAQMEKLEVLRQSRTKADYYSEEIEEEEAKHSVRIAYEFIEFFSTEEGRIE